MQAIILAMWPVSYYLCLLFGLAKKKSTEKFTYGYKKTTVLAALFNAVFLLIAIGILGFESVHRLLNPEASKRKCNCMGSGCGYCYKCCNCVNVF